MSAQLPAFAVQIGTAELRRFVQAAKTLRSEVRIDVGPDGWSVGAVDPARLVMYTMRVDRLLFQEYWVDRPGAIGLDLEKVGKVCRISRGPATVTITPDPNGGSRLLFRVGAVTWRMGTIDPEALESAPILPNLPSTITARGVDGAELARTLKSIKDDRVTLQRTGHGVNVLAREPADHTHGPGDLESVGEVEAAVDGAGRATFPLPELRVVVSAVRSCDLTLTWARDSPVRVRFDRDGFSGEFVVAARVADDGDGPCAPSAEPAESEQAIVDGEIIDIPPIDPYPVIPEDAEVEPTAENPCTAPGTSRFPTSEPISAPCWLCGGFGTFYSRRAEYPCPECAGPARSAPPIPVPVGPTWVDDYTRHAVLALGRDAG